MNAQQRLLALIALVGRDAVLEPQQRKIRGPQFTKTAAKIRRHKKSRRDMAKASRRRNRR